MLYIASNDQQEIHAVFTEPNSAAEESLPFGDPRLDTFLEKYAGKEFYVMRRPNNEGIFALFTEPNILATEKVSATSQEVQSFLSSSAAKTSMQEELNRSDHKMGRVLEDLIEVLMRKGIVDITDLPVPAQETILHRINIRRLYKDIKDIL
ncbi:MAG: hypothetical protein ACX932_04370 [Gammaproteobacteria bacterium]